MFCRKCGVENLADSSFCTGCGSELIVKSEPKNEDRTTSEQVTQDKPYNETDHPGVGESTKLFFKDIFRYGKRMGRADYWYGMLGLTIFDGILLIMLVTLNSIANGIDTDVNGLAFWVLLYLFIFIIVLMSVVTFLTTLSALVRRLHDISMSGAWVLLKFLPFGDLILLIFACQASKQKNNPYIVEKQTELGKKLYEFKGAITGIILVICLSLTFGIVSLAQRSQTNNVDDTIEYNYNSESDY